ncbi:OmpA family protein [Ferrimonas balearica]|uniref:OmpA family protein n=1 Tax=Ferrimonas balearica TaxID=44012 RepID=UPI001C99A756|nr:OmpA family protein [Ferrimonas balearica]MBY5991944.1 OmpA family protein [Ferrimonas balearica]
MKRWVVLMTLMVAGQAQAGIRNYVAPIERSNWHLEQASPLQCVLTHEIPAYGKAVFVSRASKDLNLNFTLQMRRKPDRTTEAWVRSVAPSWRPGVPPREIAQLTYYRHFDGELPKQEAWVMLTELEQGMQPTFFYRDWHSPDQVAVGLSSANFAPSYQAFVQCLDSLLPFGYEDIAFSVLHYQEKDGELTQDSQRRVDQIIQYLVLDPSVELVLTDTYTDSFRSKATNQAITNQQAEQLKDYLLRAGIPEERIIASAHGEQRHIASNRTQAGRDLNRRVVVRMEY